MDANGENKLVSSDIEIRIRKNRVGKKWICELYSLNGMNVNVWTGVKPTASEAFNESLKRLNAMLDVKDLTAK